MSGIATRATLFKVIVFVLPIVFVLFCIYMKVSKNDVYRNMIKEDAVIENMTCVAYFLASVFALSIACRFFKEHHAWSGWLYVLAFLFFAFVGMEEVSWGQRIFGTKTPVLLMEHNIQKESNLHNLDIVRPLLGEAFILISLAGACSWMLIRHRRMKSLRHRAKYFIPDWYLSLYFFFGAFITLYLELSTKWGRYVFLTWPDMEPSEMLVSFGFCLFVVITKCRQVREVRI